MNVPTNNSSYCGIAAGVNNGLSRIQADGAAIKISIAVNFNGQWIEHERLCGRLGTDTKRSKAADIGACRVGSIVARIHGVRPTWGLIENNTDIGIDQCSKS